MVETLKNLKLNFILASVLYVLLGLVLLIRPGASGILLCRLLGGTLLLYGLFTILGFLIRDHSGAFRLELLFGIVAAAVGAFFLIWPMAVLSILPVIMGIYVVVDSLVALQRAVELHRLEYPRWWISLLLSLVGVALGVLLLTRPFSAVEAVFMLIGGVFLYLGCSDLWSLYKVSRLTRELRRRAPIDVDPIDID